MEVHYSEYDFLKSLERIDAILNECDSNFEEMANPTGFTLNRKSHKLESLTGKGMLFVEVKNANKKQHISYYAVSFHIFSFLI